MGLRASDLQSEHSAGVSNCSLESLRAGKFDGLNALDADVVRGGLDVCNACVLVVFMRTCKYWIPGASGGVALDFLDVFAGGRGTA